MKKNLLLILFLCQFVYSQNTEVLSSGKDLKVGLVLSGGGAKGFAHIGALKIIEEAGVRIDYIGGTSMGAIVGALYASGYSADQLDSIVRVLDFKKLIQDDLPRKAKTFYEKADAEKYALTLPFDNFQLSFPSGVSKGQNLYNLFSKLTQHVNDKENFSDFPIPFFCIATNLETGKQKILNSGYLPRAIMASGAIPTLFSPVKINDTLYVDGGVANNYPIDEVRAMGADIIIGIDVQDTLKTKEQLKTAFDIFMQISNFNTIEEMEKKRLQTDVYLHPDIKGFNLVSFDDKATILEVGEKDASQLMESLKKIASKQKQKPTKVNVALQDSLLLSSISINGNNYYTRSYVLGKLKLRTGEKISYQRLSDGVNNLSATGNFQNVDYRLIKNDDDSYSVQFNLQESNSKMLLRLGVHHDDLFKGAALVNVTRKRLLTNNDVASFDIILGDNIRYNFDYYIDKGYYWSVGFQSEFTFFDKNVSVDFLSPDGINTQNSQINQVELKYGDLTNQLYFETIFTRKFLLRLGAEHKWLRYFSNTIGVEDQRATNRAVFVDNNYFSAFGKLKFDTLDNIYFPTEGFFFEGDFNFYLFDTRKDVPFFQYSIAKAKALFAKRLSSKITLVGCIQGGVAIGGESTKQLDFFVGGYGFKEVNNIKPFYGYDPLSLRGDTFLMSSLTLDFEPLKKSHINISANIANIGDNLFNSSRWIDRIDYTGYAVGCGWETVIGPVEVKYSYSPEVKESEWYVTVGYKF